MCPVPAELYTFCPWPSYALQTRFFCVFLFLLWPLGSNASTCRAACYEIMDRRKNCPPPPHDAVDRMRLFCLLAWQRSNVFCPPPPPRHAADVTWDKRLTPDQRGGVAARTPLVGLDRRGALTIGSYRSAGSSGSRPIGGSTTKDFRL